MLFWVLYLHLLGLGLCFFIWSVSQYMATRPTGRPRLRGRKRDNFDPVLMALEAQFLLAPMLALAEAQRLLEQRSGSATANKLPGNDLAGKFEALMARLESTHARAEPGATALSRSTR